MTNEYSAEHLGADVASVRMLQELMPEAAADDSLLAESFARVAFNHLIEPSDSVAGLLIQEFGAAEALHAFISAAEPNDWYRAIPGEVLANIKESLGDTRALLFDAFERWQPRKQLDRVLASIATMSRIGGGLVTPASEWWPSQLDDLGFAAPVLVWFRGKRERLTWMNRSVAIVGSRDSSLYGRDVVVDLVGDLKAAGVTVVSGGAFGIDILAHQAALAVEAKTVSVMAGGLDSLYPAANRAILEEVASAGLVVAESPPGGMPTKWRFLQRNRLIAALSQATVVIEAGFRSGSINTANHANQLGRPVGAIPGRINTPYSAGCHRLIQHAQAELITSGAEVLALLGEVSAQPQQPDRDRGPLEVRAYDAIGFGMLTTRQIRQAAGLTESETAIALAALELFGDVQKISGKWVRSQTTL